MKKSTKEIAREAVEEEFRRKKQKRKRGDDSSDEEEERRQKQKEKSRNKRLEQYASQKPKKEGSSNGGEADLSTKYRDRAKERREGKNIDYENSEKLLRGIANSGQENSASLIDKDDEALSKFLGGDEQHTHLVKGLDIALARKVKREMERQQEEQEESDEDDPLATAHKEVIRTKEQAQQYISTLRPDDVNTPIGKGMLNFLQRAFGVKPKGRIPVEVSTAGLAVQRSSVLLSLRAHPGDRRKAWEVPQEMTVSSTRTSVEEGGPLFELPSELLRKIDAAFAPRRTTSATVVKKPEASVKEITAEQKKESEGDDDEEDDDDDDIFADAGEYVPPSANDPSTAPSPAAIVNGSIFATAVVNQDTEDEVVSKDTALDLVSKLAKKMRARADDSKGRKKNPSASIEFQGDYGDDLDVDFAGTMEDDDDDDGKKKKKKSGEETTMAAKEYGRKTKQSSEPGFEL